MKGKEWKQALTTFLRAYRSTEHAFTGVSPAELLYGRKLQTKLPDLSPDQPSNTESVRDKDALQKLKGKEYIDAKRKAKGSILKEGEAVLLKQEKKNKLPCRFETEPYVVI